MSLSDVSSRTSSIADLFSEAGGGLIRVGWVGISTRERAEMRGEEALGLSLGALGVMRVLQAFLERHRASMK